MTGFELEKPVWRGKECVASHMCISEDKEYLHLYSFAMAEVQQGMEVENQSSRPFAIRNRYMDAEKK